MHCGSGTRSYGFVWAMGGENQAFDDMEPVAIGELRLTVLADGRTALVTGARHRHRPGRRGRATPRPGPIWC